MLLQALRSLPEGLPDLHVGVVTSSMGAGAYTGMIQGCIDWVRPKGQVVVVGVCMGADSFLPGAAIQKAITLRFSIAYRVRHFAHAVAMLAARRIDSAPMITSSVGFEAFSAAFEALHCPGTECKVLLEPGSG